MSFQCPIYLWWGAKREKFVMTHSRWVGRGFSSTWLCSSLRTFWLISYSCGWSISFWSWIALLHGEEFHPAYHCLNFHLIKVIPFNIVCKNIFTCVKSMVQIQSERYHITGGYGLELGTWTLTWTFLSSQLLRGVYFFRVCPIYFDISRPAEQVLYMASWDIGNKNI